MSSNCCLAVPGGWIAFESTQDGEWDIWAIRPDGTGLRQLVNMPNGQTGVDWSPDYAKIVYASNSNPHGSLSQLWVYDWFAGTNTKIYDAQDYGGAYLVLNPAWSPDGAKILFREDSAYNDPHLILINADGTNRQVLPLSGWVESPSWAPSGSEFVYNNRWDLLTYDFTSMRTLAGGPDYQEQPEWGPTGLIAFQHNWNIAVIDPVTGAQQSLTAGGDAWVPSWSPDGSHIIYRSAGSLWIMDSSGMNAYPLITGGECPDWGNPIPAPGAVLLGTIGCGLVGWLRRRRTL